MKDKFFEYILDHFTIDSDGKMIISNVLDWIWVHAMDKEDTVNALEIILYGIGIEREEIERFIDWD